MEDLPSFGDFELDQLIQSSMMTPITLRDRIHDLLMNSGWYVKQEKRTSRMYGMQLVCKSLLLSVRESSGGVKLHLEVKHKGGNTVFVIVTIFTEAEFLKFCTENHI